MKPLHTGLALGITVGVFYTLCALVWFLAPAPFLAFMNNLFHGLDFTALLQPRPFAWSGFFSSLLILSIWTFFAGVFFAWISNRISPQPDHA
jgi:hypothetical protein